MSNNPLSKKIVLAVCVILIAIVLGLFTTSEWITVKGLGYLENRQLNRYNDVLEGDAGNPWQYRVLAPYMIYAISNIFENLNIPQPLIVSFISFRLVQDISILLLAYSYFRSLGLSLPHALIGMAIAAWGISYSHFDSDLSFNVFFDIFFYLLAGLCIIKGKYIWIIPITILAALNRETSGLIPFLLLIYSFMLQKNSFRRAVPIFGISVLAYGIIFFGLRYSFGNQELILPYYHHWGLDLLKFNLFRAISWQKQLEALSIIPLIAIIGYKKWPPQVRVFFWFIVPIWYVIHLFGAVMAEARLFLVPHLMAFIPGALFSLTPKAPEPEPTPPSNIV